MAAASTDEAAGTQGASPTVKERINRPNTSVATTEGACDLVLAERIGASESTVTTATTATPITSRLAM